MAGILTAGETTALETIISDRVTTHAQLQAVLARLKAVNDPPITELTLHPTWRALMQLDNALSEAKTAAALAIFHDDDDYWGRGR